eukprot:gb/GEZN01000348.1/.p1 GENE.gb/GEZN01000348.1/~~gb/GEZN01000348.1/.p1  ORF type:complete len:1573 (+),score=252.12 gb/GEZN01000348.1/:477-4721(+)
MSGNKKTTSRTSRGSKYTSQASNELSSGGSDDFLNPLNGNTPVALRYRQGLEILQKLKGQGASLSEQQEVTVMDCWNKALAHKDAVMEAMVLFWVTRIGQEAMTTVFGPRLPQLANMLFGLLDSSVRKLCPQRQIVAREAYRAALPSPKFECQSKEEYLRLFAELGVHPGWWETAQKAFMFGLKTEAGYLQEEDLTDFHWAAIFFANHITIPAIRTMLEMLAEFCTPLMCRTLPETFSKSYSSELGEVFYHSLLQDNPGLIDFFQNTNMDSQSKHISTLLVYLAHSASQVGIAESPLRSWLNALGNSHRQRMIPSWAYPLLGQSLVFAMGNLEHKESITAAIVKMIMHTVNIQTAHVVQEEKLLQDVHEFYAQVAEELKWNPAKLASRQLEITKEVQATGTYKQSLEELTVGARLAWRNSAKCVGRIAWNTLQVRDCRDVKDARNMFLECITHMEIATAGTNVQSVMTVFPAKRPDELYGPRIWTSQLVRFAGYRGASKDKTWLGDPANGDYTDFLISKGLWTPPEPKTPWDVLPIVIKLEGQEPQAFEMPVEQQRIIPLTHPKYPKLAELGLRWPTVPALCELSLKIGGIEYTCCPFNGWFMELEIVRNLFERYKVGPAVAEVVGLSLEEPNWESRAFHELSVAVLHSFHLYKKTIVDSRTCARQFRMHITREKELGRECPGQWSWIGGLLGPTNELWHLEMRDFHIDPQYHYAAHPWKLLAEEDEKVKVRAISQQSSVENGDVKVVQAPRVLILYGSETGTAEGVARRCARSLELVKPVLANLNAWASPAKKAAMRDFSYIALISSTFAKGEAPSNANQFLSPDSPLPDLTGVGFSVLGLGSSRYPDYCAFGNALETAFLQANATYFVPMKRADEAHDEAKSIQDWLNSFSAAVLPPVLEEALQNHQGSDSKAQQATLEIIWEKGTKQKELDKSQWLPSQYAGLKQHVVMWNKELVQGDIAQEGSSIRQLAFISEQRFQHREDQDDSPDPLYYRTGDHLSIHPLNPPDAVLRLCLAMGIPDEKLDTEFSVSRAGGDAGLFFACPTTLRRLLTVEADLRVSSKNAEELIKFLHQKLQDRRKSDKAPPLTRSEQQVNDWFAVLSSPLSSSKQIEQVLRDASQRYLLHAEWLEAFPNLFSLAEVLPHLSRQFSRYYSISSSDLLHPKEPQITVKVVEYKTSAGVVVHGVCTTYLKSVTKGSRVFVGVRTSSFRPPVLFENTPCLMVGPGTGISPFMGFLEEREYKFSQAQLPLIWRKPWLTFTGSRTPKDSLYMDKLDLWQKSNVHQVHFAFSRVKNKEERAYVQDKLKFAGREVALILQDPKSCYYVCGAADMAQDCHAACIDILRTELKWSRPQAVQHITSLQASGRYHVDVWGDVSENSDTAETRILRERSKMAADWLKNKGSITHKLKPSY